MDVMAATQFLALSTPTAVSWFAYIIIGGFRTNSQITVDPAGFPNPWNIQNYLTVLRGGVFWAQVGNSLIAALATTIGAVALGLAASYVLARYEFKGRGALYALFAAGPGEWQRSRRARGAARGIMVFQDGLSSGLRFAASTATRAIQRIGGTEYSPKL